MATLTFQTEVPAPIEVVWGYHQNVGRALPELSPPGADALIESADLPLQIGSRVTFTMRGPLLGRRVRWVARYSDFRPPRAVVFGEEARWTDEQDEGPFAKWTHRHEFGAVDSRTTRVVDHITYRLPLGPLGWLADHALVRHMIRRAFAHRRRVLLAVFPPPTSTGNATVPPSASQPTGRAP